MTRRTRFLAAALALALPALAACGSDDEPAESGAAATSAAPTKITVAVLPILETAPVYVAKERGFFEEEGLDVTIETANTSSAIIPGVVSGQYDVGFSNMVTFLLGNEQGLGLKAIAAGSAPNPAGDEDMAAVIATDPDITELKDLAGKKVAVNALNNIAAVSLNEALREAGVDPKSVELVELGFAEQAAALEDGSIDAGYTVEPFMALAKREGAHAVGYPYLWDPDLTIASYVMTDDAVEQDPEVAKKFAAAIAKAAELVTTDQEALFEAVGQFSDIEADVLAEMVTCGFPTTINRESVRRWAELMVEDGLIKQVPADVDTMLAENA